ncbi:MBOAT family O-acyltransferase, partial [Hominenteromicrobium sp.]|uniref:MBOAT family O-acyltransferase n=1 Tax=Hominenteromicrobium sp. TaxID=3073581 RepID=UPI003AB78714
MVFSSAIFLLLFLPVVFVFNWFVKKEFSNYFLLLASLFFYAWGEPHLVILMMVSIVINWIVGRLIEEQARGQFRKKLILSLGIICNLGILVYYKYSGFFLSIINKFLGKDVFVIPQIALPIGISFFTFQAISYIVDVYRGDTQSSPKLVNVALYISFFPQLIAGPIVKYREIDKQIENRNVQWSFVAQGFRRFIYGLSKKVLISNVLGLCVDTVYTYDISIIDWKTAWICSLAYTFQIYYDFSGYSDMAIGLGKMFGFDIPENFNYPYLSKSISEFWRKWHISLGSWFREYVYIPLGGNRKGAFRTYLNLSVVFFLTGLWHGADFSFILWGVYHGFFSVVERLKLKNILNTQIASSSWTPSGRKLGLPQPLRLRKQCQGMLQRVLLECST